MIIEVYPLTKQAQNAVKQFNDSSEDRKLNVLIDGNNVYAQKDVVDAMLADEYWERFHAIINNYINKIQSIQIDWNPPVDWSFLPPI